MGLYLGSMFYSICLCICFYSCIFTVFVTVALLYSLRSYMVIPPALLSVNDSLLYLRYSMRHHMSFIRVLYESVKNVSEIILTINIIFIIVICIKLILLIHEHKEFCHLLGSFVISF